jgi:type VI secretion system secreted protein VgrG
MAAKLAQGNRIGSFQSSLGTDRLVVSRFEGSETIADLFEYRIDAVSEDQNIDFDKALGTPCSISIASKHDGVKRCFNGILVEAHWSGKDGALSTYRLVLRPWFWLLSRTTNCKIFANCNIPDIVDQVFGKHPFAKFEWRASRGSYPVMEYCVQYRESDFNFVSRLMEEVGLYYFFDHSENDHKLIIADSISSHKDKEGGASLSYYANDLRTGRNEDSLNDWSAGRKFRSGSVALKDYNYDKPTAEMLAEKDGNAKYENASLQLYDYPGRYGEKSGGVNLATVRLEAEQAQDRRSTGSGDAVTCCPGRLIELQRHDEGSLNRKYLTLRASHAYRSNPYASGGGAEESYFGSFEFQPADVPYRSLTKTPKPFVHGPQTAVVTGDGEIDVDEKGRIIVLFHWDRDRNQGNARRVRIAHGWSGAKWGDIKIPRVGMEVVVEFLEGDPDQPLVTGTVYNNDNKTPFDLPADKTISGTKSKTDGGSGYNEFVFDDKSGSELVRLHAQYDMEGKIENDERRTVGHDVTVDVGNNRTETIGAVWSVTATQKIEFIVGESKITMDPANITLKSINIKVDADAMLSEQAGAMAELKAGAILTLQGALVKIN